MELRILQFLLMVTVDSKYLIADRNYRMTGCLKLDGSLHDPTSPGQYAINMLSNTRCNSRHCPHCFMLDTTFRSVHIEMSNCHQNLHIAAISVSALVQYEFINVAARLGSVSDGTNTYWIPAAGERGSAIECFCISNLGQAQMSCDASYKNFYTLGTHNTLATTHTCATVTSDTTKSLNMFPSCGNRFCPFCFRLDTTSNSVTLTLQYCSYYYGTDYSTTAVIEYQFINTGIYEAYVSDNVDMYTLNRRGYGQNRMNCVCFNSLLSCDNPNRRLKAEAQTATMARFPESLSVGGPIHFATDTYMRYSESPSPATIETIIAGNKGLSIYSNGGKLHGTWELDSTAVTSDARLKADIKPLQETLQALQTAKEAEGEIDSASLSPAQWILSQLRPVSFRYLANEGQRFGFIADDVQQILPEMVRETQDSDDETKTVKSLLILDFIALLVSAAQSQQETLDAIVRRGDEYRNATEHRLSALEKELQRIWTEVAQLKSNPDEQKATVSA